MPLNCQVPEVAVVHKNGTLNTMIARNVSRLITDAHNAE